MKTEVKPKKIYFHTLGQHHTKIHPFLSSSFCNIGEQTHRQTDKNSTEWFLSFQNQYIKRPNFSSLSFSTFMYRIDFSILLQRIEIKNILPLWRRGTATDYKRLQLWFTQDGLNYFLFPVSVRRQSAALSSTTQHAMFRKLGEKCFLCGHILHTHSHTFFYITFTYYFYFLLYTKKS